jgi:hypothetical protein
VSEITAANMAAFVQPGDKLVLTYSGPLELATAHNIKDRLQEALPGVGVVILDRCNSLTVYRGETSKDDDQDGDDDSELPEFTPESLHRDNARLILDRYDNPPEGGAMIPRGWVEEHMDELRKAAEL